MFVIRILEHNGQGTEHNYRIYEWTSNSVQQRKETQCATAGNGKALDTGIALVLD